MNHSGETHPLTNQGSLNLATWLVSGNPSLYGGDLRSSILTHLGGVALNMHIPLVGGDGKDDAQKMHGHETTHPL